MCYIPVNLISNRIMGKDRIEPCKCGHYHIGKEVILPESTAMEAMDALVLLTKYDRKAQYIIKHGGPDISMRDIALMEERFNVTTE